MQQLIIAGLGGFIGSACRFWISSWTYRVLGQEFPYGTLLVNIVGCFLIGFFMTFFDERFLISPNIRIFLTIGILGGFTTFSSFSFETIALVKEGSYLIATENILLSVLSCLAATWVGGIAGKFL